MFTIKGELVTTLQAKNSPTKSKGAIIENKNEYILLVLFVFLLKRV